MLAGFTAAIGGGISISDFIMGSGLMDSGSIITLGLPSLHGKAGHGVMSGAGFNYVGGLSMPCAWDT